MEFTYENRKEIEKQYIHDSEFTGFEYDYDKREIRLFCDYYFLDNYHPNERNRLFFRNVIFCEMQSCEFWGMGNSILEIWVEENTEQIQDLMKKFEESKQPGDICRLVNGTKYLEIGLLLNSGDTMLIICESLCWEKESLDKKIADKKHRTGLQLRLDKEVDNETSMT